MTLAAPATGVTGSRGHRVVSACVKRMTPAEPAQRQPEATQTAMSSHRFLGIVRTGRLKPTRPGEQRGDDDPVALEKQNPRRNQRSVLKLTLACLAPLRRFNLTTSRGLAPDGQVCGDSHPAERQRGHPGIHAAAGRRCRALLPVCCVGKTRAPGASSGFAEPPSPDAAARRYPAGYAHVRSAVQ